LYACSLSAELRGCRIRLNETEDEKAVLQERITHLEQERDT
jgi:hypothetical protein